MEKWQWQRSSRNQQQHSEDPVHSHQQKVLRSAGAGWGWRNAFPPISPPRNDFLHSPFCKSQASPAPRLTCRTTGKPAAVLPGLQATAKSSWLLLHRSFSHQLISVSLTSEGYNLLPPLELVKHGDPFNPKKSRRSLCRLL